MCEVHVCVWGGGGGGGGGGVGAGSPWGSGAPALPEGRGSMPAFSSSLRRHRNVLSISAPRRTSFVNLRWNALTSGLSWNGHTQRYKDSHTHTCIKLPHNNIIIQINIQKIQVTYIPKLHFALQERIKKKRFNNKKKSHTNSVSWLTISPSSLTQA